MPPNTVYVGRPTKWGNPFHLEQFCRDYKGHQWGCPYCCKTGEEAVQKYRGILTNPTEQDNLYWWPDNLKDFLAPLKGKNLADWCPLDQRCHTDVLLELANK